MNDFTTQQLVDLAANPEALPIRTLNQLTLALVRENFNETKKLSYRISCAEEKLEILEQAPSLLQLFRNSPKQVISFVFVVGTLVHFGLEFGFPYIISYIARVYGLPTP